MNTATDIARTIIAKINDGTYEMPQLQGADDPSLTCEHTVATLVEALVEQGEVEVDPHTFGAVTQQDIVAAIIEAPETFEHAARKLAAEFVSQGLNPATATREGVCGLLDGSDLSGLGLGVTGWVDMSGEDQARLEDAVMDALEEIADA